MITENRQSIWTYLSWGEFSIVHEHQKISMIFSWSRDHSAQNTCAQGALN